MYTRCFERTHYNHMTGIEVRDIINISEYGFEWYENDKLVRTGLVDGLEATVEMLLDEGFEEVL